MRRLLLFCLLLNFCGCGSAAVGLALMLTKPKRHRTAVEDNSPPSVFILLPSEDDVVDGDVAIVYALQDKESDPVDIVVEWSDDGGANWYPATPNTDDTQHDGVTGLTSSPQWEPHMFIWATEQDLPNKTVDVVVRITPSDAGGEGATVLSDTFTVRNNSQPTVSVTTPSGTVEGSPIRIEFVLADAESDECSVKIYFNIYGSSDWNPATLDSSDEGTISGNEITGLSSSPNGTTHWFDWDVLNDLGATYKKVRIKICVYDEYQQGQPAITSYFTVDNSPETEWTGSVSSSWTDPDNWTAGVPDSNKKAIIPPGTPNSPIFYGNKPVYSLVIQSGATLKVSGARTLRVINDATISGTLRVYNASSSNFILRVEGNLRINSGGSIDADGSGYDAGEGLGAGGHGTEYGAPNGKTYYGGGGGGGHGGMGGKGGGPGGGAGGAAYDDQDAPEEGGSGGGDAADGVGYGGKGGGAVKIVVNGEFVNNGTVTADGRNGSDGRGGGAGGSIWVVCSNLSGSGSFTADGGTGGFNPGSNKFGGGGGGGGLIKIEGSTTGWSGQCSVKGGAGQDSGLSGSDGVITIQQ